MIAALLTIVGYTALFLVLAAAPILLARRHREEETIRRFAVAALGCGLLSGGVAASSRLLVDRCQDQGNSNCQDYGATGLLFLLIAGFVAVAAVRSWTLLTD